MALGRGSSYRWARRDYCALLVDSLSLSVFASSPPILLLLCLHRSFSVSSSSSSAHLFAVFQIPSVHFTCKPSFSRCPSWTVVCSFPGSSKTLTCHSFFFSRSPQSVRWWLPGPPKAFTCNLFFSRSPQLFSLLTFSRLCDVLLGRPFLSLSIFGTSNVFHVPLAATHPSISLEGHVILRPRLSTYLSKFCDFRGAGPGGIQCSA